MPIQVLLIEDNRPDAALVRKALQQQGLETAIQEIEDGETAGYHLTRLQSDSSVPCPNIVIMDLNLPRGDGIELLRGIRRISRCASVPVIVMTSSDAQKDRAAAAEHGNTRFFRKPSDLDDFLRIGELVQEMLEESSEPRP